MTSSWWPIIGRKQLEGSIDDGHRAANPPAHGGTDQGADQGDAGDKAVNPSAFAPPSPFTLASPSRRAGKSLTLAKLQAAADLMANARPGSVVPLPMGIPSAASFAAQYQADMVRQMLLTPPAMRRARDEMPKSEGIKLGEVIAWRAWKYVEINGGVGLLQSVYTGDTWQPGEPMERGALGGIPGKGVHAWKGEHAAATYAHEHWLHNRLTSYSFGGRGEPFTFVIGTVALWGDVIEFEKGYTAEFGKPRRLASVVGDGIQPTKLDGLRARYGCTA